MEAPEICEKCPLPIRGACPHMEWPEFANHEGPTYAFPGPSCPFVLLDAKDAEMEKVKNEIQFYEPCSDAYILRVLSDIECDKKRDYNIRCDLPNVINLLRERSRRLRAAFKGVE